MENIFNLKRFRLLVRKHANEYWLSLIVLIIIANIIAASIAVNYNIRHNSESLYYCYIISLVITGAIYTTYFFEKWSDKASVSSFLMLPATVFEKIALVLFNTLVLLIPLVTLIFYFFYFLLSKISNFGIPFSISEVCNGRSFLPAFALYVFIPFAFCQSLVLLYNVGPNKYWYKRIVGSFFFILVFTNNFLNPKYIQCLTGSNEVRILNGLSLFPTNVEYMSSGFNCTITSQLITNLGILIYVILTVLFYTASYFILKEKEI